jgi:transposase
LKLWTAPPPKQNSSGGKERLGSITKEGDRYLRSLCCARALAVIRQAMKRDVGSRPWLANLLARRPVKVAAIALANKLVRMTWAIMAKGEAYREPLALAR